MPLPECLIDFIGTTKADCTNNNPPASGLYVTDLEGITLNMASHIVSGEDVTGINLIKQKINFATGLVIDDLNFYLQNSFQLNLIKDYLIAGIYNDVFLPFDNNERGLSIRKNNANNYYGIRLEKVNILANTDKLNVKLKIYDGGYLTEFTFDLIAGQIKTIQLDYDMKFDKVLLVMDNSDIEVNEGYLVKSQNTNNSYGCGCGCNSVMYQNNLNGPYDKYITIRGWNGTTEDNLIYGMKLEASIRCNFDRFICALASQFKYIILYRVGIELMKEWLASERLNYFTGLEGNTEKAKFLYNNWVNEYEKKYTTLTQNINGLIKSISDSDCVICKGGGYYQQI